MTLILARHLAVWQSWNDLAKARLHSRAAASPLSTRSRPLCSKLSADQNSCAQACSPNTDTRISRVPIFSKLRSATLSSDETVEELAICDRRELAPGRAWDFNCGSSAKPGARNYPHRTRRAYPSQGLQPWPGYADTILWHLSHRRHA